MKLTQKRFSNRTEFDLRENDFSYTIRDSSGSRSFTFDYADFNPNSEHLEENNAWWRNAGLIWVVIGVLQLGAQYVQEGAFRGSIWLVLGIGCLVAYRVARTSYTIHSSDYGNVLIIQDKQHQKIFDELTSRRRTRLASALGEINPNQPPESEIAKFEWLVEQGAISEQEAAQKIAIVRSGAEERQDQDPPLLNSALQRLVRVCLGQSRSRLSTRRCSINSQVQLTLGGVWRHTLSTGSVPSSLWWPRGGVGGLNP